MDAETARGPMMASVMEVEAVVRALVGAEEFAARRWCLGEGTDARESLRALRRAPRPTWAHVSTSHNG